MRLPWVAPAFERMQHPQGHYVTRPQGGMGMFGEAWEMVIHLAEEGCDKIQGSHVLLRSW